MGFTIKEEFRLILEGKYPFLRLCEGHWKVGQLWINNFTNWERNNPILISSDDDEASSGGCKQNHSVGNQTNSGGRKQGHSNDNKAGYGGRKRGRSSDDDDDEELESKKQKGKEVATSNFHPPRPKPKKVTVGVARVCNLLFLLLALTETVQKNPLYLILQLYPSNHCADELHLRANIVVTPTISMTPVPQVRDYRVRLNASTHLQNK